MKKIGFIGLGKMGLPMAVNLCKKDYEVYVCSASPNSQQTIIDSGGHGAADYKEMLSNCDVLITIVPADKEILELAEAVKKWGRKGLVWIEMTSAKGTTKAAIAKELDEIAFLDAPVSGGTIGAKNGTLTIMAGGEREIFDAQQDVLSAMGTNIIYTGAVGSGSNIKMLNQMLNAANTAVAAEVLCVSRALGVEDQVLSRVINQSSGGSYVFERNVPKYMMSGDHTPGFRLNLMKKDVGLFVDSAGEIDAFTPLGNMIYQLYGACAHQGLGDQNYTAVHRWYENNQAKEKKS